MTQDGGPGNDAVSTQASTQRTPSFGVHDFEHLEHLEQPDEGFIPCLYPYPCPPAPHTSDPTPAAPASPARSDGLPAAPRYQRHYANASVLICSIPGIEDALYDIDAEEQLSWLHGLHVHIDELLKRIPALKIDVSVLCEVIGEPIKRLAQLVGEPIKMTGGSMMFASGVENEDLYHADNLVRLGMALLELAREVRLPTGEPLVLQMGLHSGELVSGVIGSLALRYSVYGPTVCLAKELEEGAEPGTLCASGEAHRRLVYLYPWQRPAIGSDCWVLQGHSAPQEALQLAKERTGRGDPMALQQLAFPDRRLEAPWRRGMAAQRLQNDRLAMAVLAAALAALWQCGMRGLHGGESVAYQCAMTSAVTGLLVCLTASLMQPEAYAAHRVWAVCAVRGLVSLLLALPAVRSQLSGLAAETAAQMAAVFPNSAEQLAFGSSQMLMLLLSLLFLLAIALPLQMRAQLPLCLASAAVLTAALLADGSCASSGGSAAAAVSGGAVHCLRSVVLTVMGTVVAPAVCQYTIERTSKQAFANVFGSSA